MAEQKTKKTDASVEDFIESVKDAEQREDSRTLLRLMQRTTGKKPKMWGASIVGFGEVHYRYDSGHEGDTCLAGFSPRSKKIAIYLMAGLENVKPMLKKLGKHSTGVGCLYVRRLADVDADVLESIVRQAVKNAASHKNAPSPSKRGARR
jgi:hypothetical protein